MFLLPKTLVCPIVYCYYIVIYLSCRHLKMLLQQNPLLLAAFGMDTEMIKQEIEKAEALEKLKVQ